MKPYDYQPYYCEENIWKLCDRGVHAESRVIFISNESQQVLLKHQRAGDPDHGVVIWDYHVILAEPNGHIWDFDTKLANPCPWTVYRDQTFPPLAEAYRHWSPLFRVIPATHFHKHFASDRSHMRSDEGAWLQPPPPWPTIGTGMNLTTFVQMPTPDTGTILDLSSMDTLLTQENVD